MLLAITYEYITWLISWGIAPLKGSESEYGKDANNLEKYIAHPVNNCHNVCFDGFYRMSDIEVCLVSVLHNTIVQKGSFQPYQSPLKLRNIEEWYHQANKRCTTLKCIPAWHKTNNTVRRVCRLGSSSLATY